jgi:tetratricopeptide (TPR) repeat protein
LTSFQLLVTVSVEIFNTSAVSSTLSPPKKRNSTTWLIRGSTVARAVSNGRALARHLRGDIQGALADLDQAIARFDRHATGLYEFYVHNPRLAVAHNQRGAILLARGEIIRALADFDRAVRIPPRFAEAYGNRSTARQAAGDLDSALADADRALALDPSLADAYVNRDVVRNAKGDLDCAIADLDRAIELAPRLRQRSTVVGMSEKPKGTRRGAHRLRPGSGPRCSICQGVKQPMSFEARTGRPGRRSR